MRLSSDDKVTGVARIAIDDVELNDTYWKIFEVKK